MNKPVFTIKERVKFFRAAAAVVVCLLIFFAGGGELFAQYKGAPVKRDRLLTALRSRQLQTADIVTIINRNGVDFRLTAETRKALVAAGARPEVIQAVANNLRIEGGGSSPTRLTAKNQHNKNRGAGRRSLREYEDLLEEAIYSYKERRNPRGAVRILEAAVKSSPQNPAAYQMMGFVYLYGLNDFMLAERSMGKSFQNGGSAVFRVFHDDNGKFSHRCTGSLFISQNTMRFESDNNVHTFETSTANIDKVKLDKVSTKDWKKRSVFKVTLKFGKEEAKFRFAPLTGEQEESRMVERFIAASNPNKNPSGASSSEE